MQQFYSRNKNSNRITKDLGVSLHKFYRIGFSNVPLTVSSPQFLRNSRSPELARPLAVARIEKLVVVAVSSDACRSDVSRNDGNRGGTVCPVTNHTEHLLLPCIWARKYVGQV